MAEMQDFESEEISEIEAVEQESAKPAETKIEDVLPERYRGKSVDDLVKMHQEAEKAISRQGQEVGEIRKLADELIKSQLQKRPEEPEPVKEVDFFENPQEAIRRAVETNPQVVAANQYAVQAQREMAKQKLQQLHPDFGAILQDAEFGKWIQASPIRSELLQKADAYNVSAAHELFSTFKELKAVKTPQVTQQVSEVEKTARNQAIQAAAVDTGGSGESGRKVYRRADLIRLKMTDPSRYDAMNDEILAAYREGRVK